VSPIEDLIRATLEHPPVTADAPPDPVGTLARRVRALRRRRRTVLASALGTVAVVAGAAIVVGTSLRIPASVPTAGAMALSPTLVPDGASSGRSSARSESGMVGSAAAQAVPGDIPPPAVVWTRATELVRAHPGGTVDGPAEWVSTSYQTARVVMGFDDGHASGAVFVLQLRGTFSCLCPGPAPGGGDRIVHVITEYVAPAAPAPGSTSGGGSLGQTPVDLSRMGHVHRFVITP
jgi:hypothetical protein